MPRSFGLATRTAYAPRSRARVAWEVRIQTTLPPGPSSYTISWSARYARPSSSSGWAIRLPRACRILYRVMGAASRRRTSSTAFNVATVGPLSAVIEAGGVIHEEHVQTSISTHCLMKSLSHHRACRSHEGYHHVPTVLDRRRDRWCLFRHEVARDPAGMGPGDRGRCRNPRGGLAVSSVHVLR